MKTGAPLLCWDIFSTRIHDIARKHSRVHDLAVLRDYQEQFGWNISLETLLNPRYDALVLTDTDQVILWVNQGFQDMTGYSKADALGRKPSFLQGKNTSSRTKNSFSQKLANNTSFTEIVLNYRKDNEEYLCEITVLPIQNHDNDTTHLLALEKEIL